MPDVQFFLFTRDTQKKHNSHLDFQEEMIFDTKFFPYFFIKKHNYKDAPLYEMKLKIIMVYEMRRKKN